MTLDIFIFGSQVICLLCVSTVVPCRANEKRQMSNVKCQMIPPILSSFLLVSAQESLNIRILSLSKTLIGTAEYDLAFAHHHNLAVD